MKGERKMTSKILIALIAATITIGEAPAVNDYTPDIERVKRPTRKMGAMSLNKALLAIQTKHVNTRHERDDARRKEEIATKEAKQAQDEAKEANEKTKIAEKGEAQAKLAAAIAQEQKAIAEEKEKEARVAQEKAQQAEERERKKAEDAMRVAEEAQQEKKIALEAEQAAKQDRDKANQDKEKAELAKARSDLIQKIKLRVTQETEQSVRDHRKKIEKAIKEAIETATGKFTDEFDSDDTTQETILSLLSHHDDARRQAELTASASIKSDRQAANSEEYRYFQDLNKQWTGITFSEELQSLIANTRAKAEVGQIAQSLKDMTAYQTYQKTIQDEWVQRYTETLNSELGLESEEALSGSISELPSKYKAYLNKQIEEMESSSKAPGARPEGKQKNKKAEIETTDEKSSEESTRTNKVKLSALDTTVAEMLQDNAEDE